MWRLAKVFAIAWAIVVSLTVWGLGGPAEAYAIARIDGVQVVPLFPFETCYPAGFTSTKYRHVSNGDTPDAVRARLGEPLSIVWSLDDKMMGKFLWFEPVEGQWRSGYAHEVDVPKGTPMSALAALRSEVAGEQWTYSRSCIRDDSKRVRWVSFRRGRVDGRGSGVYYD